LFRFLKLFLPPILVNFLLRYKKSISGWHGNYNNWQNAQKECSGYNNEIIFKSVLNSALKVKSGEFKYERDSIIYDEIQYSWPLLSFLLYIINIEKKLIIIDYGGSFGTSYYQNKKYLDSSEMLSWNIIEQKNFVKKGQELFSNKELNFYFTIDQCCKTKDPNTALFSSSLQYLAEPYSVLDEVLSLPHIKYIIIDLIGVLNHSENDRITVQKVSPEIYDASYPCRFFNENNLIGFFKKKGYSLVESFNCDLKKDIHIDRTERARYKGYFFRVAIKP
jgi:putative methyltransferase (TIGR04325 family)